MHKSGRLDKYTHNVEKLLNDDHAELVPPSEINRNDHLTWYVPHHGVVSESKPGKLRTVFDCAASLNGVSFNNQCFKGPDLVNSLLGVLLRFRLYKYAFLADIESMYLQVKIPPVDRNALRFLWKIGNTELEY